MNTNMIVLVFFLLGLLLGYAIGYLRAKSKFVVKGVMGYPKDIMVDEENATLEAEQFADNIPESKHKGQKKEGKEEP